MNTHLFYRHFLFLGIVSVYIFRISFLRAFCTSWIDFLHIQFISASSASYTLSTAWDTGDTKTRSKTFCTLKELTFSCWEHSVLRKSYAK